MTQFSSSSMLLKRASAGPEVTGYWALMASIYHIPCVRLPVTETLLYLPDEETIRDSRRQPVQMTRPMAGGVLAGHVSGT